MPAPQFLSGLPKPMLFGLYGAVGGLLGALVFGEPAWWILRPASSKTAASEPQLAVAAPKDVEVFNDDQNAIPIQIARDGFDDPVTVRFEDLPPGVSISPITIDSGQTTGEATIVAVRSVSAATTKVKMIAEATPKGKKVSAETPINAQVTIAIRPQADVFFVLDVTASMQWAIQELKDGIGRFADSLSKNKIDFRLGLVAYRDLTVPGETVDVILFKGEPFTSEPATFRDKVSELRASGGGDIPESTLEAVTLASQQPFRKGATKLLLVITDAPPKVLPPTTVDAAVQRTATTVRDQGLDSVHLVVLPLDLETYKPLLAAGVDKGGGQVFNLGDVVRDDSGFEAVLNLFSGVVTAAAKAKTPEGTPQVAAQAEKPTIKGVQSSQGFAKGTEGQLVLAIGVWTGAIAALICFALLAGQYHYLRGQFPPAVRIAAGLGGGLVVGIVGGAAGQGLYLLAPNNATLAFVFQVFGWALLGGLAGVGLSLFIPNLKWVYGLAGGAIGGAVGAGGYLVVTAVAGDLVGRLIGGLIVGFCIGLMVALVEAAFRRAWLEVRYGARETITVNLGPEPVKVGGDAKMCTVWARGASPLALRFFLRDGQVICDDAVMKRENAVADGFAKEVGNVTVTVRTGSGTAAPTTPSVRVAAPPPLPKTASTPALKPLGLGDDDFDGLPMAMSPPPAPPLATPPVPVSSKTPLSTGGSRPDVEVTPPKPTSGSRSEIDVVPPRPPVPAKPAIPPKPAVPVPPKPALPVGGSKPTLPPVPPKSVSTSAGTPPAAPPAPPVPPKPSVPAASRHPDACPTPTCGRVNAGKRGSRYCMVCDQTY